MGLKRRRRPINVTGDDTHRLQFDWDEKRRGEQTIVAHDGKSTT